MEPGIFSNELFFAGTVSLAFLGIFAGGEMLHRWKLCSQEATRKFVHLLGGLVSINFAWMFTSHWTVLALCIIFVLFIGTAKKFGFLPSVHGVERKSTGDILLPVAIYFTFLFSSIMQKPQFYTIAILVLSVSDALAAVIGSSYGFKIYRVEEEKKSFEGSIIFFLSTFIITHIGLLLLTPTGRPECVLAAVLISLLVTAFEAISLGGTDNLFIPFGTFFILVKITDKPLTEIAFQLFLLAAVFFIIHLVAGRCKSLGASAVIGISLLGYGSWSLVEVSWFFPVLISTGLLTVNDFFLSVPEKTAEPLKIRAIFYLFSSSFFWVIGANLIPNLKSVFFLPFILGMAAGLSISWWMRSAVDFAEGHHPGIPKLAIFSRGQRCLSLSVFFLPLFFFEGLQKLLAAFVSLTIGVFLADAIFATFARPRLGEIDRVALLRYGMVINLGVSLLQAGCFHLLS